MLKIALHPTNFKFRYDIDGYPDGSRNKIEAVSILELEIQFLRRIFKNSKWMHRSLK